MNCKLTVVQQYLSWKGHYRQYFENLLDEQFAYLHVSKSKEIYPNGEWVEDVRETDSINGVVAKIKGRFINSYLAYKKLVRLPGQAVHLIEFEPLSFLMFSRRLLSKNLLITIHSSDNLYYTNWISNAVSKLQRKLLDGALRVAISHGARIVTHYECHRQSLITVLGRNFADRIHVIHYPAPEPKSSVPRQLPVGRAPRFLIYGQIREDKGVFEFFQHEATRDLNVTVAGRILDERILGIENRPNLRVINKFLSDDEISNLIDSHDYMLLPYPLTYTNGAGTFKDSLANAMPVVCSDISIFTEIVDDYGVGVIFKSIDQITNLIADVSAAEYLTLSRNCLNYAFQYDWAYMRRSYFTMYHEMTETQMTHGPG